MNNSWIRQMEKEKLTYDTDCSSSSFNILKVSQFFTSFVKRVLYEFEMNEKEFENVKMQAITSTTLSNT